MMELANVVQVLAYDGSEMFWPIAGSVAVVAILAGTMSSVLNTRQREKTRREVAAYVASGTIDKDTAVAILKAGHDADEAEAACT
jgi:hypothetical protein